jgi:hypothetical protein
MLSRGIRPASEGAANSVRPPTSVLLERVVASAPAERITLAWLLGELGDRSFGIFALFLALIALLPGVSLLAGILLMLPAVQMILARRNPVLPRFVAAHRISTARLDALVRRLTPVLKRLERVIRPRWASPPGWTKRSVGVALLAMAAMLLIPIPFSQFIPALVIGVIAIAYLEEDGLVLAVAMGMAAATVAAAGVLVWGAIAGVEWLAR